MNGQPVERDGRIALGHRGHKHGAKENMKNKKATRQVMTEKELQGWCITRGIFSAGGFLASP